MDDAASLSFRHVYRAATAAARPPLLLLHGTGGDENDLVSIGQALAPGAALLSPRGKVLERGLPRFFGRPAEGLFDAAEVRRRTLDLAEFTQAAGQVYGLAAPIAVGFSNGANVAATLMALRPEVLAGAVLLRPMAVLDDEAGDLTGRRVLMLSGAHDPIVPAGNADQLAALLRRGGATVQHRTVQAGHGLVQEDLDHARHWLDGYPA